MLSSRGRSGFIFLYNNKEYLGETAAEIVREIQRDEDEYPAQNGSLKNFLAWSLTRKADRIPRRELDVSEDLPDEVVAFNYLCLLDNYDEALLVTPEGHCSRSTKFNTQG